MKSGTKGVVAYNGKLLLILRDDKPHIPHPNTWELIGGAKEENETFEEAGIREIEEELGVKPKNYQFIGADDYDDRKAGRFIALLSEKEYKRIHLGNEGQKYDFFTLDDAIKLEMAPNLKNFLKRNKQQLKTVIEKHQSITTQNFTFVK